jgi:polysaccharide biosynthesis protein VpsM
MFHSRLIAGCASAILAVAVQAQTLPGQISPGAPPAVAPTPTPTPDLPTAPGEQVGAALVRHNPAVPVPEIDWRIGQSMPARRGFLRPEPFFIYPHLGIGIGHDDNLTHRDVARISSPFWRVTPRVDAELRHRSHVHGLRYAGHYTRYTDSAADNFNEHELVATSVNRFTARADLVATAYYLARHDARGTLDRPLQAEPDRWNGMGASATVGYGARTAQGRLEFEVGVTDKEYRNNRAVTAFFDASTINLAGRFFYRVGPRTRLLAEVRHTDFNYKLAASPLDNDETRVLIGVTWDFAAATSGTVKAGYMTKRFDDPGIVGYSGASLETGLRWLRRSYSIFDVVLRHEAVDPTGPLGGALTVNTLAAVSWNHRWRSTW